MAPLGKHGQPARARVRRRLHATSISTALTDFFQMRGPAPRRAAPRAATRWRGRSATSPSARRTARSTFTAPAGVALQGPQLAADAAADARERYRDRRARSATTRRCTPLADRRRRHLRVRSRGDPLRAEPRPHRRHLRRVRRRHRLRRAIEDAVPRHQPQLAGERSLARRHHDRVRRADAARFRSTASAEFDGVMLGAFRRPRIEGRLAGSEMRAWDVTWGDVDGDFVVENSYANISRAVIRIGPVADGRDRAVLARLSARRRRRGDRRPHPRRPSVRSPTSAKRSTCRTTTSTARCRATSTSTATTRGRTASAA